MASEKGRAFNLKLPTVPSYSDSLRDHQSRSVYQFLQIEPANNRVRQHKYSTGYGPFPLSRLSYNDNVLFAWRLGENLCSAVSDPSRAILSSLSRFLIKSERISARLSGDKSMRRPFTPFSTSSGRNPILDAMTGTRDAMASLTVRHDLSVPGIG